MNSRTQKFVYISEVVVGRYFSIIHHQHLSSISTLNQIQQSIHTSKLSISIPHFTSNIHTFKLSSTKSLTSHPTPSKWFSYPSSPSPSSPHSPAWLPPNTARPAACTAAIPCGTWVTHIFPFNTHLSLSKVIALLHTNRPKLSHAHRHRSRRRLDSRR